MYRDTVSKIMTLITEGNIKKKNIPKPSLHLGFLEKVLYIRYIDMLYRDTVLEVCVKNGPSVTDVWEDRHGQVDWDATEDVHIVKG